MLIDSAFIPVIQIEKHSLEQLSIEVKREFKYDFTQYAASSFRRRIERIMTLNSIKTTELLLKKLKKDKSFIQEFVHEVTVNTTEMFRDDTFWIFIRKIIENISIDDKARLRIWHAGCSTGEEVYSMAIMLQEIGLLGEVEIIATDINTDALSKAKEGKYPLRYLESYETNYQRAKGERDFSTYYKIERDSFFMNSDLLHNVEFLVHDLVNDADFPTCDLVICRNVFIYFNTELQNKVFSKITNTLKPRGYLAIGSKESIAWCHLAHRYTTVSRAERIYQLNPVKCLSKSNRNRS